MSAYRGKQWPPAAMVTISMPCDVGDGRIEINRDGTVQITLQGHNGHSLTARLWNTDAATAMARAFGEATGLLPARRWPYAAPPARWVWLRARRGTLRLWAARCAGVRVADRCSAWVRHWPFGDLLRPGRPR